MYEHIGQSVQTIAFTCHQQIGFLLRGVLHITFASSTLCKSKLKKEYCYSMAVILSRVITTEGERGKEIEIETLVAKYTMKARLESNQLNCLFKFGLLFWQ
jgi:hypothetical protein